MARAKPTTVKMVAKTDFDYVTAGRVFNVTTRDGDKTADFRRAEGDTACGTYVPMWQVRRQVAAGNLQVVA